MRFQPVKCNIMQLTKKRIKKINAVYSLEGTVLENVDNIKYLGVTISKDLKWNTHVSNICTKANRPLGFLRRNLSSCPQDVKETAYKGLVRSILEYASPVSQFLHAHHPGIRLQGDWGEIVASEGSVALGSPEGDKNFALNFCDF